MQSWLRTHTGGKTNSAAGLVHRGRALDLLPATAAAFAAGAIGIDHVTAIAVITAPRLLAAAADQGVDLGEIDAALATIAAGQPFAKLAEAVERYLAQLDPDGPEPEPVQQRSLTDHHPPRRDGDHPRRAGPGRWGEGQSRDRTHRRRLPHRRRGPHPRPGPRGRVRAVGRHHPRRRAGAGPAHPQARHRRRPRPGRPRRPRHRQDRRPDGLRRDHLRRPRPLAGL